MLKKNYGYNIYGRYAILHAIFLNDLFFPPDLPRIASFSF